MTSDDIKKQGVTPSST